MKRIQQCFLLVVACAMVSVHASGVAVCSVSSTGTAFGAFDTLSGGNKDVVGTISVTCSGNVGDAANYVIALSLGGGSFASRSMQAGGSQLSYNLYSDGAHTLIWGDGTGGTSTVSDSYSLPASSSTRQYTVYGRIPGGQSGAVAGDYADTMLITLTY
ncbi:MAG TPA: spore coat U domain-containing protein [Candidatus Solibacter sp.]|nr:spore coat U domain-containing protein [Candidatus Solibacter sp.]